MFTSSVAMPLKLKDLEEVTDSKIEKVKTYTIFPNNTAKDPKLHLDDMIKKHITTDTKFSIMVVGSNDIDNIVGKEDAIELVEKQAERLVTIAATLATENEIEVFISELIPRHDDTEGEVAAELSVMANSFLKAKVAKVPHSTGQHLHVVKHNNLFRPPGSERDKLYRNGKHLTNLGLKQFSNNLVNSMSKIYKDINVKNDIIEKPEIVKPKVLTKKAEVPKAGQEKSPDNKQLRQPPLSYSQPRHHRNQQGQNLPRYHQQPYQQQQRQQPYWQQQQQQPYQQQQQQQPYQQQPYQQQQHQQPYRQQEPPAQPPHMGYWGPPSSPPPSPRPPPAQTPQYHWTPVGQGQHYRQGGQHHYTSGQY